MSRNKVQFQKGMSIHSFIEKYGSIAVMPLIILFIFTSHHLIGRLNQSYF